jgi:integrase
MATITRRPRRGGGYSYRVQIRRGHANLSETFDTRRDAQAWARENDREAKLAKLFADARGQRKTLADLIDRYMAEYDGHDPQRIPRLAWWKDTVGTTKLPKVTPDLIADALDDLRAGYALHGRRGGGKPTERKRSEATINRYHAVLSAVFRHALDKRWGWVKRNPCLEVSRGKESGGRRRWLDDSERERLLQACRASEWPGLYPMVMLALSTGARRGELLGLRWRDVDLKAGRAILHDTKNGDPRTLPLVKPVREALEKMPRRIDSELLFPSVTNPEKPRGIYKVWWAALKAADISGFKFHDLRHSCASYLAASGASTVQIAEVLGHRSLAMAYRYSHLADRDKAELLERVTGSMLS